MNVRYFSILLVFSLLFAAAAPLFADKIADDLMYDNVRRRLASDPDVKGALIDVDVKDGAVRLRGTVKTDRARQKAERLTRKVKGVKTVANELKVAP